ncbi:MULTISPECIES: hypothetical protein [unclassified Paenibacillus]|uniref:hypothetical protein n=1 Tax=unclassified Paenibacillus TaxID=185978 RepID=UPI0024070FE6|nr:MULTISPECIES: hypothetical protein [unclassified Paenibacillus]MDF9841004.1 hypothetical protein [Paenibacillus sp. PastF-2]MDF9847823.1 hypothetical protein [Paenibacillus sp. PastM-2]MDF9854392.1 hypothetical protein [Paenibacillus sp. PastF-1]MDH6479437.1 hypothetical protein [Paenibacillus sp. PastH-2]MDH6505103.1 hypothetical protein [Paenibacillus sp. PastM-3]
MRFQIILLAAALAAGLGNAGNIPHNYIKQAYITSPGSLEQFPEGSAARLYTSLKKEKGKYTDKVKALLNQLMDGLHASH